MKKNLYYIYLASIYNHNYHTFITFNWMTDVPFKYEKFDRDSIYFFRFKNNISNVYNIFKEKDYLWEPKYNVIPKLEEFVINLDIIITLNNYKKNNIIENYWKIITTQGFCTGGDNLTYNELLPQLIIFKPEIIKKKMKTKEQIDPSTYDIIKIKYFWFLEHTLIDILENGQVVKTLNLDEIFLDETNDKYLKIIGSQLLAYNYCYCNVIYIYFFNENLYKKYEKGLEKLREYSRFKLVIKIINDFRLCGSLDTKDAIKCINKNISMFKNDRWKYKGDSFWGRLLFDSKYDRGISPEWLSFLKILKNLK